MPRSLPEGEPIAIDDAPHSPYAAAPGAGFGTSGTTNAAGTSGMSSTAAANTAGTPAGTTPSLTSHPQLVGRTALLASVETRLAANVSVVLTGPSGIGKTAVLEAVSTTAGSRGELVLHATGVETERWIPYAGLADLLGQIPEERLGGLPEARRAEVRDLRLPGYVPPSGSVHACAPAAGEPYPPGSAPSDRGYRPVRLTSTDGSVAGSTGAPDPDAASAAATSTATATARSAAVPRGVRELVCHEVLEACSATSPVLLLIDDAQWLDHGTVDAIRYATRRLAGQGVRAVIAGRWPAAPGLTSGRGNGREGPKPHANHGSHDTHSTRTTGGAHPRSRANSHTPHDTQHQHEERPPRTAAVPSPRAAAPEPAPPHSGGAPWAPTPTAVQLPVPPLPPEALAELFERYGLPARIANKLHADSGGNPLLALALGGAFTDRIPRHWRPAPLPQRVHTLISERVATLPTRSVETLLLAACATRPTIELLHRAGRETAEEDIRLATAAGLLLEEAGGLHFTPPAVATVLAEQADAEHRLRAHTLLAAAVPDAASRIRHRALAATGPDDGLARSLVTSAETASRQGAHRMAAELYLLAADRTPTELAAERLEWLVAAAEAGACASLPELVHRAADAVLDADSARHQRVRVRIALIDLSGQGLSEMDEIFAAALLDAEGEPALMAPLLVRLSWSALVDGQPERCETEADRALEHSVAAVDPISEAMALVSKATVARVMGRDDYTALLDRALRLPEPPLNGWLHAAPRFLAARFAVFDDRLTDARADLLRMLALVERGCGEEIVQVLRSLSEVSVRMGRCRDALDFADRAVRISEEASLSPGPGWHCAAVAELAGGSVERALGYAERGVRASEQERDAIYLGRHLHVRAQALLRTGDLRGGVGSLRRIQRLERQQGLNSPLALRWHGDLVAGLAVLGQPEAAATELARARTAVGDRARGVGVTAQLDRAEAALLLARGEPDAALDFLGAAADRFTALGQPLETGHCLLERARVERGRRRNAAARAAVHEALTLFTGCEARPWAEQAGRSLAEFDTSGGGRVEGGPSGTRTPEGFAALSANEQRIAWLVGDGATNQEVATQMFLSVKTIEAALTRVYRKLGVRSRTELGSSLRSASSTQGPPP
ncbi:helix-turn-helix transcriptional regulator [Streptomyces oceani]|uniref:helix-turn-helix transcriptional regulator n=1 Tax=Streptomyces oceani TaxID=1075402 RepID=UPI00147FFFAF|nr:LuxR family transcriptional regulator [Streptomyces oceani]